MLYIAIVGNLLGTEYRNIQVLIQELFKIWNKNVLGN